MKRINELTVLRYAGAVLAFAGAGIVLSSCGGSNADEKLEEKSGASPVTVATEEVSESDFTETIRLSGTIKAYEDVMLSPEEGGVLKERKVRKGQYVHQGDLIGILDEDVLRAAYESALAQYRTAELTYQRQQKVFEERAISEWQLKTSEYARDAAKAQADLARARWERMQLRSPINGILDDWYAEEGEMAPPGSPIARIVNIASVKVVANVPERYAGSIALGTPVTMTVIAYSDEQFTGKISFVGSAISPDNRTFPVEIVMPNSRRKLKPEMIARVSIMQSAGKKAILVSEDIVQQVDRNKYVVFVANDNHAYERVVQLGGREKNMVEIVSGLKVGDHVVVSGYQNLVDGQPVTIVPR